VGNIRPIKGHDILVRAFKPVAAAHPDSHLVIVGDGPGRSGVEALVRECGLERSVHLAGLRTNVAAFLEAFDVFVLPSRAEGMSNALLEALLLGKPSIATRFGLPRDAAGRDVVLPVEPESVEALSAAMLRARTDASLREDLRRRARDYAATALDVKRMAREYEALYWALARGGDAAGGRRRP
jgi:glycosyltransferase involved in cell wall biosynthesis